MNTDQLQEPLSRAAARLSGLDSMLDMDQRPEQIDGMGGLIAAIKRDVYEARKQIEHKPTGDPAEQQRTATRERPIHIGYSLIEKMAHYDALAIITTG